MKWLSFLLTASTATAAPAALPGTYTQEAQVTNAPIVVTVAAQTDLEKILRPNPAKKTLLELQDEQATKKQALRNKLTDTVDLLQKKYVGKTWYVFSGATPQGWDCSGLVRWVYEQVGITLEHRASIQGTLGKVTDAPIPGDVVVFTYNNTKSAYHTGIYIGDGLFIHAPRKGEVTRIESVEQFAGKYSTVTYRNMLDN
jgi:cell wall-associated NlpC family hydrolase